jgi:hypothetical protein
MKIRSRTKAAISPSTLPKLFLFSFRLIFVVLIATIINACSGLSNQGQAPAVDQQPMVAHKIAIVNASTHVVNTVEYRPCGSTSQQYQTLTRMLRPSEKLSITIYSQCVDLMATNAFKKTLVDNRNIDLSKTRTWTIQ